MPNIRRGTVLLNRQPVKIVRDFNTIKPIRPDLTILDKDETVDTAWQMKESKKFDGDDAIMIPVDEIVNESSVMYFSAYIKPEFGHKGRMNIFEGQEVPISIALNEFGRDYDLQVSIHTVNGWHPVDEMDRVIRANVWTHLEVVFTMEEVYIFINGVGVCRRLFYSNIPVVVGDHDYVIGAWIDGRRNPFKGHMKDILIESCIPESVQDRILMLMEDGLGEIESKYLSLGGRHSFLGNKIRPLENCSRGSVKRLKQVYERGEIYWSLATGAHEVHGSILSRYKTAGAQNSALGLPMTDEEDGYTNGCKRSRFENGAIYWSSQTGAHIVSHEPYLKYVTMGEDKSFLSLPTKSTRNYKGGLVSEFKRGNIYYSADTGIHEVHGAILQRYKQGCQYGFDLGFPKTDEVVLTRLTSNNRELDTGYRSTEFEHGIIFWSARTGAREVHGAILKRYLELGGYQSNLGLPTSDELRVGNGNIRYNNFEKGLIMWKSGIGAIDITDLRLFIEKAKAGSIDDGPGDSSAELLTYTTIKENDRFLEDSIRRPRGDGSSSSRTLNIAYTFKNIQASTKIYLKVKYKDWDDWFGNDYLGTIEKTYSIENFFGFKNKNGGIYHDTPMTHKGGDAGSLNSVKLDYSIGKPSVHDSNKAYRDQYWWPFSNFCTSSLSRNLYADTFTDVEVISGSLCSKLLNPLDTAYYELAYEGSASAGNCFGMCLEALYAKKNKSKYTLPLSNHDAKGGQIWIDTNSDLPKHIADSINFKHGYQLGTDAIWHLAGKFATLDALIPNWVYSSVVRRLLKNEPSIVCMFDIGEGSGHAVLAYDFDRDERKIYVCDPNLPYSANNSKEGSYIQVKDNKFKFYKNGQIGYQSESVTFMDIPTVFMFDYPYSVLSSQPSTPTVSIFLRLALLMSGIFILAGDAEVEQVSMGNKNFYNYKNNKKTLNRRGISGMTRMPLVDTKDLEFYTLDHSMDEEIVFTIKGKRQGRFTKTLRTAYNSIEVKSQVKAGAKDYIKLEHASSSRPMLVIESDEDKTFDIKYELLNDVKGKNPVTIEVSLNAFKGRQSKIALDALDGGIILEQGKDTSAITVVQHEYVGNQLIRSDFVIDNPKATEIIKINPRIKQNKREVLIQRFNDKGILIKKEIK